MGVRFRIDNYSHFGNRYRYEIWDSDYSGTIYTDKQISSAQITWGNEGDRLCEPLQPSTCEITIQDDGSVEFITFELDLSTAQENEFKLIVYKHNGSTFELYWAGVIMADMVSYRNVSTPRDFTIIAKDGLNRLSNIEFTKINSSPYISGGISAPQTILKIIFDCLSYTETAQFWNGSGVPYIRVCQSWMDTAQVLDNSTATKYIGRILECMRVDRDFLFDTEFDDKGQGWHKDEHWRWINEYGNPHTRLRSNSDHALKARTILRELLQILNLRLTLSDGSWYITQMAEHANASVTYINYDYTGTYQSRTTGFAIRQTTDTVLSDGIFGYFPCIKTARCTILPSDIVNVSSGFNDITLDKNNATETGTIDLGNIYGGVGSGLRLRIGFDVKGYNNFFTGQSSSGYPFVDVELEVQFVGTDETATDWAIKMVRNWTNKPNGPTWTNTTTDVAAFAVKQLIGNVVSYGDSEFYVYFETPEIPFDTIYNATLEVSARIFQLSDGTTLTGASSRGEALWIKRPRISIIDNNNDISSITEFEAINPNLTIGNSFDLDLGKMRIHDTGIATSKHTIEVDEYVGAGRWYLSGNWDANHDTDRSLIYTILREHIAFQTKPVKSYTGGFIGSDYVANKVLSYDSTYWVFHSGTQDLYTDVWDGVWWKINRESIGIALPTELKNAQWDGRAGSVFPVGKWMPPDVTNANYPVANAKLDTAYDTSTPLTSISTFALAKLGLRPNDVLGILDPVTGHVIDEITIDDVTAQGDTSITIQSITPSENWGEFYEVTTNNLELSISKEFRATETLSTGEGYSYSYTKILKASTTGTTTTELTLDGAAGSGTTNRIVIDNDTAVTCMFYLTFKKSGTADSGSYIRKCLIYNNGGTVALQGAVQTIGTDEVAVTINAVTVTISANNTNDCLKVEVNGIAATNINYTCRVDLTVVKYA